MEYQFTNLNAMFKPNSIALIGASGDATKLSGRPLRFMMEQGYQGRIYPVNPRYQQVMGIKSYPSLSEVPEEVDLVIIALPASAVPEAIAQCSAKNAKAIIVYSSGFAEVGEEGKKLQEALYRAAMAGNVAVCGPNCAGLISVRERAIATFNTAMERETFLDGPIAFVSQSGALGAYLFGAAQDAGLGINYWVSSGNEAVIRFPDYVSYFIHEKSIKGVIGYLEDVRDGKAFLQVAQKAMQLGKPLIFLKVGGSKLGALAAQTHTGSTTGSDRIYDAVFSRTGVLRASDEEELFDLAAICTAEKQPQGRNLALITISGGAGILMADQCEQQGLRLARLSSTSQDALRKVLPAFASVINPIDLTAELSARPALLKPTIEIAAADPEVHCVVVFLGLQPSTGAFLARDIVQAAGQIAKPLVVSWMNPPVEALQILQKGKVTVFPNATRGIRALAALANYNEQRRVFLARPKGRRATFREVAGGDGRLTRIKEICLNARRRGRKTLSVHEALECLKLCGFPQMGRPAGTKKGFPVELAIKRDERFGLVMFLGLGKGMAGIPQEVLPLAFLDLEEISALVQGISGHLMADGGKESHDLTALEDALWAVGRMTREMEEDLEELVINQLLVLPKGGGVRTKGILVALRS